MKKVFKFGTGDDIPEKAVYLCTKTETVVTNTDNGFIKRNAFVWHYFLVEIKKEND